MASATHATCTAAGHARHRHRHRWGQHVLTGLLPPLLTDHDDKSARQEKCVHGPHTSASCSCRVLIRVESAGLLSHLRAVAVAWAVPFPVEVCTSSIRAQVAPATNRPRSTANNKRRQGSQLGAMQAEHANQGHAGLRYCQLALGKKQPHTAAASTLWHSTTIDSPSHACKPTPACG